MRRPFSIPMLLVAALAFAGCQETGLRNGTDLVVAGAGEGGEDGDSPEAGGIELTEEEKAQCPVGRDSRLRIFRIFGRKRLTVETAEPVAIVLTGLLAELSLVVRGEASALCIFARGASADIVADVESAVEVFHYESRGAFNDLDLDVTAAGSLAKGKVVFRGFENEVRIFGSGDIVCPDVEDRRERNDVSCGD